MEQQEIGGQKTAPGRRIRQAFFAIVLAAFMLTMLLSLGCDAGTGSAGASGIDTGNVGDPGGSSGALAENVPGTGSEPLRIGFIYIGTVNDGGYTQAQNEGTLALEQEFRGRIEIIRKENVSDRDFADSRIAAEELISDGCKVIVGTSYGFGYSLAELANSGDHDDVIFLHFSGNYRNDHNLDNYFGAMEEPRYLTGIIAGMQTKSNNIGYVAALPIPEVLIGINAFALGVQSVNPNATVNVAYTTEWYDSEADRQATKDLIAAGCDVIAQHADSPEPQKVAAESGIPCIGYNIDNTALPGLENSFLTAPIWHHEVYLIPTIESILGGTWQPAPAGESWYGTLADGYVDLAPLTGNVTPEAAAKVDAARKQLESGTLHVFTGPIEYYDGLMLASDGEVLSRKQIWATDKVIRGVIAP